MELKCVQILRRDGVSFGRTVYSLHHAAQKMKHFYFRDNSIWDQSTRYRKETHSLKQIVYHQYLLSLYTKNLLKFKSDMKYSKLIKSSYHPRFYYWKYLTGMELKAN